MEQQSPQPEQMNLTKLEISSPKTSTNDDEIIDDQVIALGNDDDDNNSVTDLSSPVQLYLTGSSTNAGEILNLVRQESSSSDASSTTDVIEEGSSRNSNDENNDKTPSPPPSSNSKNTIYEVLVRRQCSNETNDTKAEWFVYQTFTEFRNFRKELLKFMSSGPLRKENTYQQVKSTISNAPFPSRRLLGLKRTAVIEDRELKLRSFLSSLEKSLFPLLFADHRPHVEPLRKIVKEFLNIQNSPLPLEDEVALPTNEETNNAAAIAA